MAYVYTCGGCGRQYTVYEEGEYICDCGTRYRYPAVMESKARYAEVGPVLMDSSSHSFKRARHSRRSFHHRHVGAAECPMAKASLLCAILSIPFFGILAPPALIFGFAARLMIANPRYRYTGDGMAVAGIIVATLSLAAWSVWFISLF